MIVEVQEVLVAMAMQVLLAHQGSLVQLELRVLRVIQDQLDQLVLKATRVSRDLQVLQGPLVHQDLLEKLGEKVFQD